MRLNGKRSSSSTKAPRIVRTPLEFEKLQDRNRARLLEKMDRPDRKEPIPNRTGWLPGPLSYPWIFIAIGISDLANPFYF